MILWESEADEIQRDYDKLKEEIQELQYDIDNILSELKSLDVENDFGSDMEKVEVYQRLLKRLEDLT